MINQTIVHTQLSKHSERLKTREGPAGVGSSPGSFAKEFSSFS